MQLSPIDFSLFLDYLQLRPNSSTMNSKFSYSIAASFNAKYKEFNLLTNIFNFDSNAHIIKNKEDKSTRPASGQDAFFISRMRKSGDVAFRVADRVGG